MTTDVVWNIHWTGIRSHSKWIAMNEIAAASFSRIIVFSFVSDNLSTFNHHLTENGYVTFYDYPFALSHARATSTRDNGQKHSFSEYNMYFGHNSHIIPNCVGPLWVLCAWEIHSNGRFNVSFFTSSSPLPTHTHTFATSLVPIRLSTQAYPFSTLIVSY